MSLFGRKLRQLLSPFQGVDERRGYRRLRIMLYVAMFIIFFLPLLIATGLSSFEYRELLIKEERAQLLWNAEGAEKTIEAFMEKLTAVVKFVSKEHSLDDFLRQNVADNLLANLKEEYSGFVDLGIIDHRGIQQVYSGPFKLKDYDYSEQDWYTKVLAREVFISDVFMGFREIPHFVIAVSNKIPGTEGYWVMRASIDYEKLQKYITATSTKASQDIFLVNSQGVLQTRSNMFGEVFEKFPMFSVPKKGEITIQEGELAGTVFLQASANIKNTPWIIVMIKKGYVYGEEWSSFRNRLRMIFVGCTLLVTVVIYQLVNSITNRLRDANEKRDLLMLEAEHSNKLASIGRLAAGVAHEINNPLAIIDQKAGLMTDLLDASDGYRHKEKFIKTINGIQNAVERCKVITHRLLGFARRMDVVYERIDINSLLKEVLGFLEKEAFFSRIRLELVLGENLPMVFSDRGQLQQIFLNILNNAIDAVGKDGEIVITTTLRDKDTVAVLVSDNGPGMSAEIVKRIFDPFFTTKEAGKGTGLGLSITYGLAKKLGGNITVESKVGQGTIFVVALPINAPPGREDL